MAGVWVLLHRALYPLARLAAGRKPEPTLAIMDGQSVKTTERGGVRGFDGHKRVKGRKRHILVDILGLPITNRVGPANTSDHRAGSRLLAGLAPLWPTIRNVVADAGHESRKLARQLRRDGMDLQIVKRKQRSFKGCGSHLDRRAQFRMARVQSSPLERLRMPCADIRNAAGCRCNSLDASSCRSGMNFSHGLSTAAA